MTALNLFSLAVADTATVHLKGVNGELLFADAEKTLPAQIGLYSPGSDQYAIAESNRTDRVVERQQNQGSQQLTGKELRAEQVKFLVDCTAFANNITVPGDLTGPELYGAIYSNRKIGYIYDQMNRKLGDWATFTPGSATN